MPSHIFWISQRKRCGQPKLLMTYKSYTLLMPWKLETVPEFDYWFIQQSKEDQERMTFVMENLKDHGPVLKRPYVGKVEDSYLFNLKELIPPSSDIRILFIFDPKRRAVLLLGGDKSSDFKGWYKKNIPVAEARYVRFLKEEGIK